MTGINTPQAPLAHAMRNPLGFPIPPPPSPRGDGHAMADTKTARRTARPALVLAGGEPITTGRKASEWPRLEARSPVVTLSQPILQP